MVELNNISFSYGTKKIFLDVNIIFDSNSIYYVQGENGIGKTTLLELLVGIHKPNKGRVLTSFKTFGYVPAKFSNQFPISVREFLQLYDRYFKKSSFNEEVDSLLKKLKNYFQIENIQDKLLKNISLGELKKVLIIRACSYNPDCIILDEPFAHLDAKSSYNLKQFLLEYSHLNSCFFFIVDHQKILEREYKSKIIEIKEKKIFC